MPEIKQLTPGVINKIAAGEVIERPASLVKELMENAVDAGATRVDVTLQAGGAELVRVADNGCGMRADQLMLAVASHATSKIADADDLFSVRTMGFRGEALASIAEVSRTTIRSRAGASDAGAELEIVGGSAGPIAPCGCPPGTVMEIRDLFFNTPVRQKFLRTTQTEMGHATEAFTRIALAWPDVHFTLKHNERTIHDLPPVEAWHERIGALFGTEIGESLILVEGQSDDVTLSGYVAHPEVSRSHNRMQYLFLNSRHIRDRSLQHALGEAYRGLLLTGRYPVVFLRLDMPPDVVDVNVHPTKLEVRFQDGGRVYSQLLSAVRTRFLTTDLTSRVQTTAESERAAASAAGGGTVAAAAPSATQAGTNQELVDWARGQSTPGPMVERQSQLDLPTPAPSRPLDDFRPFPDSGSSFHRPARPPADPGDPHSPSAEFSGVGSGEPGSSGAGFPGAGSSKFGPGGPEAFESGAFATGSVDPEPSQPGAPLPTGGPQLPSSSYLGMQLHNRYLITENRDGVVIIDQHALHERIIYEQLREKAAEGKLETQRLLVPETVTLAPAEAAAVLDSTETLQRMGIQVEPFGGDTVIVSSYPAMLANMSPGDIVRQMVDVLMAGDGQKEPDRRDLLDELLHMIACKAAIKAGDRLTSEEITTLLEHRDMCQDSHHCPHGRPTALVFTRGELDKMFKRI